MLALTRLPPVPHPRALQLPDVLQELEERANQPRRSKAGFKDITQQVGTKAGLLVVLLVCVLLLAPGCVQC